ncbi:MAG: biotin/lipoyl-binding protein [Bacteroidales bacterium]
MKRTFITTSIIVVITIIGLIAFNKLFSKKNETDVFVEANYGKFEITINAAGELMAERAIDIMGPEIRQSGNQGGNRGQGGGGGRGMDFRIMDFKIQDIVPEGTVVKKGDYIARLDRTNYDNTLKDAEENLKTLRTNVEMKVLDTTMTLTALRDEIKNQRFTVEEAEITLAQSKFEPPATIRMAQMNLDKAKRSLEQKIKGYELKIAQ